MAQRRSSWPGRLTRSALAATTAILAFSTLAALGGSLADASSRATSSNGFSTQIQLPYGVGRESLNLVDNSRSTPANGSAPALPYRDLSTLVLYPAVGLPQSQPVADAPPANTGKPYPLIVFAHGLGSEGFIYDPFIMRFVESGFVVVAPTFPLSNIAAPGGASGKDLGNQPADMSFVLSQVLALSQQSGNPLSGMIDPHKIAGVGHSLGAMTVLAWTENTCCRDPLVDASVIIDGTETKFGTGKFFAGKTTPILVLHGTADKTIPYTNGEKIYKDAKSPKFMVSLIGAPHVSFLQLGPPGQKTPKWEGVDVASIVDFLDGELNHNARALHELSVVAQKPGVSSFKEQTSS